MSRRPLVTVLMSVHNGAAFIQEAVESVLTQTLEDFEFLLYDDASTDGTTDYLMGLRDPRLSVFRNEENLGLAATLNRGIDMAKGEYVARMDADDVCVPDRLQRQV